jgi:hypothetical protein
MVGSSQHGITGYYFLERSNSLGAFQRPHKGHVLLGEPLHRLYYVSIPLDEGAIVSKQAQCAPDVMYIVQHFLSCGQAIALGGVDANDSFLDSDS